MPASMVYSVTDKLHTWVWVSWHFVSSLVSTITGWLDHTQTTALRCGLHITVRIRTWSKESTGDSLKWLRASDHYHMKRDCQELVGGAWKTDESELISLKFTKSPTTYLQSALKLHAICALKFTCKHVIVNTCYISSGMRVRKVFVILLLWLRLSAC